MTEYQSFKFMDENELVRDLAAEYGRLSLDEEAVGQQARVLVESIRATDRRQAGFQSLVKRYDLTSEEGLALMTLAEALLRVPDADTANALIQDKIGQARWETLFGEARDMAGRLSGLGLSLSQKVMGSMIAKIGMPFIRSACIEAMRVLGKSFVLGRDITEAIKSAQPAAAKGYVHSYDMLGEGARTFRDADRYFDAYRDAIRAVGQAAAESGAQGLLHRPGISVKLSALHPRYEFAQKDVCVPALSERLAELCAMAMEYGLNLTVDAEEARRLDLSMPIIESIVGAKPLRSWDGFGLAVQAYQKQAGAVIDKVIAMARRSGMRLHVRLVKGAYWDTEIKYAQIEGHPGYPVFTRKDNTDLHYLVCASRLLAARDCVTPLFGTHNAHTVAAILAIAGAGRTGFGFQRLHGMGSELYDQILAMDLPACIYAPVGTHQDLLAYLVRRLLENGANSSFVHKIYGREPVDSLIQSPYMTVTARREDGHAHPHIPLPDRLYSDRRNSAGLDLQSARTVRIIEQSIDRYAERGYDAPCILNGEAVDKGHKYDIGNPANKHDRIGTCRYADRAMIDKAFRDARKGYAQWSATSPDRRADILNAIGDAYEANRDEILALLIREAGKTIPDAVAELREAVDFCRYYAVRGREDFAPQTLEGPTGEDNRLFFEGRGVFVCISPWNFPLAIFMGQVAAALMAGNAVIAKPAEQTPAIAAYAVRLMLRAGIPDNALMLLQGDGAVGEALVAHPDAGGVAFTGSTTVAKAIQRALAAKDGPIVPLIAETGGLNAMIVDSTALAEQVTDDVLHSAFGSAGQRCSALRILCLQNDIADGMTAMIKGAMDTRIVGDPARLSTDVGPIIDGDALAALVDYRIRLEGTARRVHIGPYDDRLDSYGTFFPPVLAEMEDIDMIDTEAFGPILHIVRFAESDLPDMIERLNAKGYGLTFGLHTRIRNRQKTLCGAINAGNIYINRGQTGAVVGVQPFGGRGLSGTGPKAGGPLYLHAFAVEKVVSDNITAAGGNTVLVNLRD